MSIKLLSEEITLGATPDDVDSATVVRVLNDSGDFVLVTRADESNTTIGSMTLANNEAIELIKYSTDLLYANADVKAVSIAYTG
jgi:hypothetical protein